MLKLFTTKRTYTAYDGEEYIDMCIPVVDTSKLEGNFAERITQDENGRIDKYVWNNVARNLEMIDILMYANNIFNPFAVKEGELLSVPIDNDKVYVSSDEPSLPNGTKHSNNTKGEKTRSYAENVEYLASKGLGVK